MKTIHQYLTEKKVMAEHNLLCYSKTYGMDTPKEGYEEKFAEAIRDCEIVEELIKLVQLNNEIALVRTTGILYKGKMFYSGELISYIGDKVLIVPSKVGEIDVFKRDKWICTITLNED
ncbi:hypothetical protein LY28_02732 [Ruminiclostridium sufflavum DSM 19573]|uniref:Uncharacterized protein n=1 Tax=Ruminiclostridium sufflavum DSM 19573 TaxID=1121337 RepID=A0A318XJJ1_9FIRM|nr:hypothetical protein [Ruminiclostridium sufflavum]PYG86706.1 hypothetical protein LY28_02732 [Ruminiclostridium sufflavum DSM 19573]